MHFKKYYYSYQTLLRPFFDGLKHNISKGHNSRIKGRRYSYCSISLVCQKGCHETFISYKAHSKVGKGFFWKNLIEKCAITLCSNIKSKTSKFDLLISAIFDKIIIMLCKKVKIVNDFEICLHSQN